MMVLLKRCVGKQVYHVMYNVNRFGDRVQRINIINKTITLITAVTGRFTRKVLHNCDSERRYLCNAPYQPHCTILPNVGNFTTYTSFRHGAKFRYESWALHNWNYNKV